MELALTCLLCLPASAAEAPAPSPTASPGAVQTEKAPVHFFGSAAHLQATADQVTLGTQGVPLPITISGNAQRWTSGPGMANLYTQAAQASYRIDDTWQLLGQELFQQQASIQLMNFVGGFKYKPDDAFNINVTAGAGIHTLYTYQWSTYVSPQYRLPWTIDGSRRVSLEADTEFENYALGNFFQVTPKLDVDVAPWVPQMQVGYAFGDFNNTTSVTKTQYYQPQTLRGVTLTLVFNPLKRLYIVTSVLPSNRNYIAGNFVVQTTLAATVHWNIARALRLSAYAEESSYQGGSYRALGGGIAF